MLTVQQVADRLQLSIKTVRRMAARGDFPGARKLGGEGRGRREWRIPENDVDQLHINRGWEQFRRGEVHEIPNPPTGAQ